MNLVATDSHIDLVLFRAGGFPVACEARHVRTSQGAATEGAPLVETVLELPLATDQDAVRQRLTLKLSGREHDLLVTGPLELTSMPITHIHPLPPLLEARNYLAGLRALILLPGREPLLLFDVAALRLGSQ